MQMPFMMTQFMKLYLKVFDFLFKASLGLITWSRFTHYSNLNHPKCALMWDDFNNNLKVENLFFRGARLGGSGDTNNGLLHWQEHFWGKNTHDVYWGNRRYLDLTWPYLFAFFLCLSLQASVYEICLSLFHSLLCEFSINTVIPEYIYAMKLPVSFNNYIL